nr:MAG TPA: hypothetical protein [Caudoviricetes sp.]
MSTPFSKLFQTFFQKPLKLLKNADFPRMRIFRNVL